MEFKDEYLIKGHVNKGDNITIVCRMLHNYEWLSLILPRSQFYVLLTNVKKLRRLRYIYSDKLCGMDHKIGKLIMLYAYFDLAKELFPESKKNFDIKLRANIAYCTIPMDLL
jgi:hypothetical protein